MHGAALEVDETQPILRSDELSERRRWRARQRHGGGARVKRPQPYPFARPSPPARAWRSAWAEVTSSSPATVTVVKDTTSRRRSSTGPLFRAKRRVRRSTTARFSTPRPFVVMANPHPPHRVENHWLWCAAVRCGATRPRPSPRDTLRVGFAVTRNRQRCPSARRSRNRSYDAVSQVGAVGHPACSTSPVKSGRHGETT